jgi:hypothetical protein
MVGADTFMFWLRASTQLSRCFGTTCTGVPRIEVVIIGSHKWGCHAKNRGDKNREGCGRISARLFNSRGGGGVFSPFCVAKRERPAYE